MLKFCIFLTFLRGLIGKCEEFDIVFVAAYTKQPIVILSSSPYKEQHFRINGGNVDVENVFFHLGFATSRTDLIICDVQTASNVTTLILRNQILHYIISWSAFSYIITFQLRYIIVTVSIHSCSHWLDWHQVVLLNSDEAVIDKDKGEEDINRYGLFACTVSPPVLIIKLWQCPALYPRHQIP